MDDLLDGARALLPSLEWHRLESGTGVWALIPGARLRLSRDEDGCRAYLADAASAADGTFETAPLFGGVQ